MKIHEILNESLTIPEARKILGLNASFTADDVKRAYALKSREHHPDKGGDVEKMKEINNAYKVLKNVNSVSGAKANWDEIHAKYNQKAKEVVKDLTKKFKPQNFVDYFSKIFGEPFDYAMAAFGDTEPKYGSHTSAGFSVKFFSKDKKIAFDMQVSAYLPNLFKSTKTLGGENPNISYPLSILAYGYFNNKKVKMAKRDFDFKNDHSLLTNPELVYPSKKLENAKKNAASGKPVKIRRADMILAIKNEVGAKPFSDGYILDLKDGAVYLKRMVFTGTPVWQALVGHKPSKFRFTTEERFLFPESVNTIEALNKIKTMDKESAIKYIKSISLSHNS